MAGRKLFLADDSITIQKVINLTFADEGIEVLTAGDGDTALQRIVEEMPDLVLSDVNMPGLTGYELCELLRGDDRTRHIPVILLVGAFEPFDEAEAARVGATSHLTKPFQSIRQLINQVTDQIEAGRPAPEPEQEPEPEPVPYEVPASLVRADPFEAPVVSEPEPLVDMAAARHDGVAESDPATDPGSPEPDDIDRLYRQSIGEESVPAHEEFPDLGVDDEMIETSYTAAHPAENDFDLLETATETQAHGLDEKVPDFQEHSKETPPTSPYETTELNLEDVPNAQDLPEPAKDQTIRLDPVMVEAAMAEANRRFEETEEQPRASVEAPREPIGEETIRMDSRFDTRGSGDFELEDIDLLDIPSRTEVEVTTPAEALAHGGKQVVTLSPELIEMIAQRVVEKLSERY